MIENYDILKEGKTELPNGCTLYWELNGVGGRTYISDEIGGGVHVWDTCIVDDGTLLTAMSVEKGLERLERHKKELERFQSYDTTVPPNTFETENFQ